MCFGRHNSEHSFFSLTFSYVFSLPEVFWITQFKTAEINRILNST